MPLLAHLAPLAPIRTDAMTVEAASDLFERVERTVWMGQKVLADGTLVSLTQDVRVVTVVGFTAYVHHYASDLLAETAFDLM